MWSYLRLKSNLWFTQIVLHSAVARWYLLCFWWRLFFVATFFCVTSSWFELLQPTTWSPSWKSPHYLSYRKVGWNLAQNMGTPTCIAAVLCPTWKWQWLVSYTVISYLLSQFTTHSSPQTCVSLFSYHPCMRWVTKLIHVLPTCRWPYCGRFDSNGGCPS